MTTLEKKFVNRKQKGEYNIARVRDCFNHLDLGHIYRGLELGCGIGAVSAFLANEYNMNITGTDFDAEQVELARSLHPETDLLHYRVEDASRLTFPAHTFDLVIAQNVFHHIPEWEKAVQEVARVLSSGGYFIWFDLAVPGLIKKVLKPAARHSGLYTLAEVRSEFLRCGFTQLYYDRIPHGPFSHHHLILQKS
ncbi:MAG: class I SAM-dependent methyltransferase [Anaerolineales bacterium]|nr:class I SAM-dependent methyltransferase [Anaerolineales bacterium]